MELWIRSQDKEKLVKCNDIAIATDAYGGKTIRGYKIVGYFDKQTEYEELGFYTLHSRALEVLEDINAYKDAMYMLELSDPSTKSILIKEIMARADTFTYNMPEE